MIRSVCVCVCVEVELGRGIERGAVAGVAIERGNLPGVANAAQSADQLAQHDVFAVVV